MQGFAEEFSDPPSYILGITKRIWEDRAPHTLRHYYAPDIAVRSPAGVVTGNEPVIAATLATLAEFGDRQLLGEDVIWCADPGGGFLSSHRIMSLATHTGNGAYGSATGKRLRYRVIADCAARDNQIYDEWLIRDQGAIVRQLGTDPKTFAAQQINSEGGPQRASRPLTPATDAPARYRRAGSDVSSDGADSGLNQAAGVSLTTGSPAAAVNAGSGGHDCGHDYAGLLEAIMSGALNEISCSYDRAVESSLPGGITGHGTADIDAFWLGLRSAFPSAAFEIHHRIGRDDPKMPPRAALRWSLHGSHDGWGTFGPPSGADVYVMGISHAEFGPYGIRREYVAIDETAIWKQILLHTG